MELQEVVPDARIVRMDVDVRQDVKDSMKRFWNRFENHEADILIGTQMIAKGLGLSKRNARWSDTQIRH